MPEGDVWVRRPLSTASA